MKRGSYGKPYRPPPDGWSVPPKVFFGGLYQHLRSALNNLPKFVNTTQVPLQPNQVGQPYMRYDSQAVATSSGCFGSYPNNNPQSPWIGLGANQGLPAVLGGNLNNTYTQEGTNSFGQAARLRGGKWVQAVRQWHGTFGWLSQDGNATQDTNLCFIPICDVCGNPPPGNPYPCTPDCTWDTTYCATYQPNVSFTPYQPTPDQTKYLTITYSGLSMTNINTNSDSACGVTQQISNGSGTVSINAFSGQRTQSLSTSETDTYTPDGQPTQIQRNLVNGYDSVSKTYNVYSAWADAVMGADFHNWYPPAPGPVSGSHTLLTFPSAWNQAQCDTLTTQPTGYSFPFIAEVTNPNSYSASVNSTVTLPSGGTSQVILAISWTRTNTSFTWNFSLWQQSLPDAYGCASAPYTSYTSSGTITLSNPNTSAAVYADTQNLLGYWNLADDAQYPPRTDGIWQIAPLVSRDEQEEDISPLLFNPYYVNDLRQPIVDASGNSPFTSSYSPPPTGWTYNANNNDGSGNPSNSPNYGGPASWTPTYNQMAWYDPAAYGFTFPAGMDQSNSPATGFLQYGLTGLICGMPMPAAFTNPASYWYNPAGSGTGVSPVSSEIDCENFFDFRAQVWSGCRYTEDDGEAFNVLYLLGHGQWCYDMITLTGAQLPHCATQWTNLYAAYNKSPYAYLIQADQQTYDQDGQPGEDTDFFAYRPDALWAQKCCEILEIWPSQDFFRPAGNDRFAADETAVYCLDHWVGQTIYFLSDPANINTGDLIGVNNNSYSGIYTCSVDHGTLSIEIGNQLYPLPTGFALPSGDTGAAVWKVRFPNAPAILGRDAVSQIVNNGDGTVTIVLASPEVNLMPGDTIDICTATIQYDTNGNKVNETMTVIASSLAVLTPRIDDQHFKVTTSFTSLASFLSLPLYLVSHGAPNWYWDDTGRKGDLAALNWLYDYRTNGEISRLAGVMDCTEQEAHYYWTANGSPSPQPANTLPPPAGTPATNNSFQAAPSLPAVCTPNNSLNWTTDNFQARGATVFQPCCYGVVAITPNRETWNNAIVIPFPAQFNFDDKYGARWQAEIEQAMTDLLYQTPHNPCGNSLAWTQDNGTCEQTTSTNIYYPFPPLVETRLNLPTNGGPAQNETAPALPAGITIGYLNPVTNTGGLTPPGTIGYTPNGFLPNSAFTFWGYRQNIENNSCFGSFNCFNYVDTENLPCVTSYTPPAPPTQPALTGLPGIT